MLTPKNRLGTIRQQSIDSMIGGYFILCINVYVLL